MCAIGEALRALAALMPDGSSVCVARQGNSVGIEYTSPASYYYSAERVSVEDAADRLVQWKSDAELREHPEYSRRNDFEGAALARGGYR